MFSQGNRSRSDLRVFGGSSHPELTKKVAKKVGVRVGELKLHRFANKETSVQLLENVRGQDIYVIQTGGTKSPNDDLMELLLLINAFKLAAAGEITVITPCFPYSKGDQKDGNRVPIASKLVADLMKKSGATYIMMLDPHTPQLEGFFDSPVDALKVEPLFCEWVKQNVPQWEECVVVSPDEGGTKRSVQVANDLQLDFALIHNRNKEREEKRVKKYSVNSNASGLSVEEEETDVNRRRRHSSRVSERKKFDCLSGDVEGRRVIIVDDMIDTGRTLKFAVEVLQREGAAELYFLATHGIFCNSALEFLSSLDNQFLKAIVVSNSIPQNESKAVLGARLHVVEVSGLIAEFIRRHHYRESVSVLSQFMPIRDEPRHKKFSETEKVADEAVALLKLDDDQASGDPEANQAIEDEPKDGRENIDPRLLKNVPGDRAVQRLRKGFRLSSVCWDTD